MKRPFLITCKEDVTCNKELDLDALKILKFLQSDEIKSLGLIFKGGGTKYMVQGIVEEIDVKST